MEAKRRLTFLVIPSSPHKRSFSISVPFLMVPGLFFAFGFVLLIAFAGIWRSYHYHQIAQNAHRLEMENRAAKAHIKDQEGKIEQLTQALLKISERTAYIQNYLGLKAEGAGSGMPPSGMRAQGGIELAPQNVSKSYKPYSAGVDRQGSIEDAKTGSFSLQDIGQLDADLKQIVGTLRGRQEKLERVPSISPVGPRESWISSPYGMRISPFTGQEQFHPGIDIAGAERTPIMAPAKGTVVFVGREGSLGMTVRIKHDSLYESTYGHLKKAAVKKGQRVDQGDVIGYMGNSGRSTGPHLHYAIEKNGKNVNPFPYMKDWRDGSPVLAAEK
jgi:murein DD-endopeptidase MepM/ murein hydrolase activator NlpD